MAVRTAATVGGNAPTERFLASIDPTEQAAMEGEGAVFPPSTTTLLSDDEFKVLKGIRRKLKNKQSAQKSREQEKHRVDALEQEVTVRNAATEAKRSVVAQLLAENAAMQAQLTGGIVSGTIKGEGSEASGIEPVELGSTEEGQLIRGTATDRQTLHSPFLALSPSVLSDAVAFDASLGLLDEDLDGII
jgi:hypothetical protein